MTGVQTCALPISRGGTDLARFRAGFEAELCADGYVGEHGDGVLALLRIARLLDGARILGGAPITGGAATADGGAGPDPAAAGIRLEEFRAGLTPEDRGWLAVAAEKVLSAQASDLYDRWALTDDLDRWLAGAREDLEHLRAGLGTEPEGPPARP